MENKISVRATNIIFVFLFGGPLNIMFAIEFAAAPPVTTNIASQRWREIFVDSDSSTVNLSENIMFTAAAESITNN